jgi:hypothetical protein
VRIYVASSWRNTLQPGVVSLCRSAGHDVYDFRNPPNRTGFGWGQAALQRAPDGTATAAELRVALEHPVAVAGYESDIGALRSCDACVLVLPSGRSASWEFGYAMGQGKRGIVVQFAPAEPELMYRGATICGDVGELLAALDALS